MLAEQLQPQIVVAWHVILSLLEYFILSQQPL